MWTDFCFSHAEAFPSHALQPTAWPRFITAGKHRPSGAPDSSMPINSTECSVLRLSQPWHRGLRVRPSFTTETKVIFSLNVFARVRGSQAQGNVHGEEEADRHKLVSLNLPPPSPYKQAGKGRNRIIRGVCPAKPVVLSKCLRPYPV